MKNRYLLAASLALCLSLPLAAQAGRVDQGIAAEVGQELADARTEVRVELAKARKELLTEDLRLDNNLQFGRHGKRKADVPEATITARGDFVVAGKAQSVDATQRRMLLAYRHQVVGVALTGLEAGQEAADAALDAVGGNFLGILFNALSGRLEDKVERVVQQKIQPMVLSICRELPTLMASQQQLAASLPAFRPYANLEPRDIEDCEDSIQNDFASR